MSSTADDAPRQRARGAAADAAAPDAPDAVATQEQMPRVVLTRGRIVAFGLFVVSAIAFLYFVLPKIAGSGGLTDAWSRIDKGDPLWLGGALGFEVLSFLGYVALFRGVFVRGDSRVDWRESYQITMAGLAATRLFAAAGAGGVALTAWALRRSGMEARIVACRMVAFMVLLYAIYMLTLVVCGLGLNFGLFAGGGSFAITVIPAIFGGTAITLLLCVSLLPAGFERRARGWATGRGRMARVGGRLAAAPATAATGIRTALGLIRRRDASVFGAIAWWGFDIMTLWACFHAFGVHPAHAVIVMAYFVGTLANVLPVPGGIGSVDGGLIGAFVAFGVPVDSALVGVLTYRVFSFWLPTVPGVIAYLQLRRTVQRWETVPAESA